MAPSDHANPDAIAAGLPASAAAALRRGVVIPACPLALNSARRLDERSQRALFRYYRDAGAGGLAVGVHTTQFAIREPRHGLFQPVLALMAEEMDRAADESFVRIGGVCGPTSQAVVEAGVLRELGYHAGLVSLAAFAGTSIETLIVHLEEVSQVIPIIGFYLQPAVGGRVLPLEFWRRVLENPRLIAIKIAPFNRYQTLDVIRAAAYSGREDVALYTGNDDQIVLDLLTRFSIGVGSGSALVTREVEIVGGLLGHWAVWTSKAVRLFEQCAELRRVGAPIPRGLLTKAARVTEMNAAVFDAANRFAGCIAGIHEVLRRQGVMAGVWCLDPGETLSAGQSEEITRVMQCYPELTDEEFVTQRRDYWLAP